MQNFLKRIGDFLNLESERWDWAFIILSGLSLALSFIIPEEKLPFNICWIAIVLSGAPIVCEALKGLFTKFDIKADFLVAIALVASICIKEYFAAAEVAFIMQLGEMLEEFTVGRARAGLEKLVNLTPRTARLIKDGEEKIVPAEEVAVNDILRVLAGETVPVDGVLISGESSINEAVLTGESLPIDKGVGDMVSSGTVNQYGAFEMRALKIGEDSSLQRMIRLVQTTDAGKAKIVGFADKFATWVVVIALLAAVITWGVTGEVIRAVAILVVFCPCALVLATPTAIMAGIGNCTRHGFLVREGDALERLSKVNKICLDKTGTLTRGIPEVTAVYSKENFDTFAFCAAAEQYSEHPLGKAVLRSYKKSGKEILAATDFKLTAGRGVKAGVDGKIVLAGNTKFLAENRVAQDEEILKEAEKHFEKGCTVIFCAIDGVMTGFLALSDSLREDSKSTIAKIKKLGITPVLLTGDHKNAAAHIASELKIDEVFSDCLPQDKLSYINSEQEKKNSLAMLGDGINDAPALKKSDIGIAMGGVGSDIAIEAADIALINDEIKELPHLLALARRMMFTIKINMAASMLINFVAIALAAFGNLSPVEGALVHNGGAFLVILNSAWLLKWQSKI